MKCHYVSDGLLSQENVDWKDRMIALEKKVVQQDDEIICLKSALADCIRRLNAIEANKGKCSFIDPKNVFSGIVYINQMIRSFVLNIPKIRRVCVFH